MTDNVIPLRKPDGGPPKAEDKPEGEAESFEDIEKRNKRNDERVERERLAANKGVLRSYRIKH